MVKVKIKAWSVATLLKAGVVETVEVAEEVSNG